MSDVTPAPDHNDEIVIEEERRRVNGTGLTALIIVILSFVAPIVIALVGSDAARYGSQGGGEAIIGILFALASAALVAVSLDVVGIIVGIVSLFRKNRGKLLGLIAIFLGLVPIVVVVLATTVFSNLITTTVGQ